MKEKFVHVKDFENYMVSNTGRVVRVNGNGLKELKPQRDAIGYMHVRLYPEDFRFGRYPNGRGKIPKLYKVHKLVALHFLPKPDSTTYLEVNHLDSDKENNVATNLQWCTKEENIQHSWDVGARDNSAMKAAKKRYKPLKVTFKDGTEVYYESQMHATLDLKTSPSNIGKRCKGEFTGYGTAGFKAERITELPKGKKFKTIRNFQKLWEEYHDKYYRNAKEYREKRKKRQKGLL